MGAVQPVMGSELRRAWSGEPLRRIPLRRGYLGELQGDRRYRVDGGDDPAAARVDMALDENVGPPARRRCAREVVARVVPDPAVTTARVGAIRGRLEASFQPSELEIVDDSHLHAGHAGARDGRGHFRV